MRLGKLVMVALIGVIVMPMTALADYIAVGSFEGEECTSYLVLDVCDMRSVDAVKGDDGRLYSVRRRYPDVSKYWVRKKRTQMCRINLKGRRAIGLWDDAANLLFGSSTKFYTKTSQGYKKVDVEFLQFKCRKVN